MAFAGVLRLHRDGCSAPAATSRLVFQIEVTIHKITPIIAYTFGRDIRTTVAFAKVATVVTHRSKANKLDGTVGPSVYLGIGRCQIAL